MIRNITLGAVLAAFALIVGCDKSPASAENDARDAQRRAAEEVASAQHRADEAAASAQAKAAEEAKRAEQTLIHARNDLRDKTNKEINDLSARIDDLRLKAAKATGKTKADLQASLQNADKQMVTLKSDLDALDRTTAAEFDAFKARVDAHLSDLKKTLNETTLKI